MKTDTWLCGENFSKSTTPSRNFVKSIQLFWIIPPTLQQTSKQTKTYTYPACCCIWLCLSCQWCFAVYMALYWRGWERFHFVGSSGIWMLAFAFFIQSCHGIRRDSSRQPYRGPKHCCRC